MSDIQPGKCESGACISVDSYETVDGIIVRIHSDKSHTTCQATVDEFVAFRDRIKLGAYDHIGQDAQVTA